MASLVFKAWGFALAFALGAACGFNVQATERSSAQVRLFRKLHACPKGPDKGSHYRCRGMVVDHIKPLDCGGKDAPSNMQYQTIAAAKAKDKVERNGPECKHRTHG